MNTSIRGLAYYPITFDEHAITHDGEALATALEAGALDNIFILAHGWNTSVASAENLYQEMFGYLADMLGTHRTRTAAVGIFWPAAVFPDDDPQSPTVPTGAPSTGQGIATALKPVFPGHDADLDQIGELLDQQPHDMSALTEFRKLAAGLVTGQDSPDDDAGEPATITRDPVSLFGLYPAMANQHSPRTPDPRTVLDPFPTLWKWAADVLRILSYYTIKSRAGAIGQNGLGPLIAELPNHPRVHLMGHSFGARLVSFALRPQPSGTPSPIKSLLLIQGAFSHFTFAEPVPIDPTHNGALADCRDRVDGPLLATYSAADRALAWWYPAATYLAHHDNPLHAEPSYQWGALGHDGFQQTGAIDTQMLEVTEPYNLAKDQFYRLNANAIIAKDQSPLFGAHSDIRHPEILWAAVNAAGLT